MTRHDRGARERMVYSAVQLVRARDMNAAGVTSGPLSQRQLSDRLRTDAPYTSVIVDDIEQRGLVRREAHPADRRSKLVRVTPGGWAVGRKYPFGPRPHSPP